MKKSQTSSNTQNAAMSAPINGYQDKYRGFPLPASTKASGNIAIAKSDIKFAVESIDATQITPEEFYDKYVSTRTPVVLRNCSGGEFASLREKWLQVSYLRAQAGDSKVRIEWKVDQDRNNDKAERNKNPHATTSFGRGQHTWMSFNSFLDHIIDPATLPADAPHKHHSLYLTSQPIDAMESTGAPVELCAEPVSSLLPDMPLRPSLLQSLTPVQYNCWIGRYRESKSSSSTNSTSSSTAPAFSQQPHFHRSPGTTSGLHHDYHDNLYVLLSGHKYFHLYPPNSAPFMYCHGMNKQQQEDGEDENTSKKNKKQQKSSSEPACIIHDNGVIEYTTNDALNNDNNTEEKQSSVSKSKNSKHQLDAREKKLQQMMEEELEEEENEEEEEEEENAAQDDSNEDADGADAENAEMVALAASRQTALSKQLSELTALHSKAKFSLKYEPRDSKKFKHLTNEEKGLANKIQQLHAKMEKSKQEEEARLKQFNEQKAQRQASKPSSSKSKRATEEDEDDDDEGSFPDVDNMQDDYEASDDDEAGDAIAMDFGEDEDDDDDDDEEGEGFPSFDDDDDDEDEDIDPAEKAAWEAFMKQSQKKKPASKQQQSDNKKRKLQPESDEEEEEKSSQPKKKVKNSSAAASSTPSTAVALSPQEETYPSNFSRVDFIRLTPDQIRAQFPLFAQKASKPFVVKVQPGEMLFLPASWFHEVFSSNSAEAEKARTKDQLDSNVHFALNYWFAPPSRTGTKYEAPYITAQDQAFESEFESYYKPRVMALKRTAEKRQKVNDSQPPTKKKVGSSMQTGKAITKPQAAKPQPKLAQHQLKAKKAK